MDFGATLKQLRNEAGLSQLDFADKIDVHSQTVSKWERNISLPDFSMLGIIAENLGVGIDTLLGVKSENSVSGNFDNIKFGEGLRLKRKEKGLSQGEFGLAVGVNADVVSKWERGLICPDFDRLKSISDYYGVLPSELYFSKFKEVSVATTSGKNGKVKTKWKNRFLYGAISLVLAAIITLSLVLIIPKVARIEDLDDDNQTEETVEYDLEFSSPVENPVILREESVYYCLVHNRHCILNGGLDFAVKLKESVYAVTDGEVVEIIEPSEAFSKGVDDIGVEVVIERADGVRTVYWSVILNDGVEVGTKVKCGQEIGRVGNHHRARCQRDDGGSVHVHIEKDGETINLKDKIKESE